MAEDDFLAQRPMSSWESSEKGKKWRKEWERADRAANPEKHRARVRAYRERNREKIQARRSDKWHSKSPEEKRAYSLMVNYGITYEHYQAMYEAQQGKCAICADAHTKLNVDHCHNSGRVRGLLCHPCNQAVGLLRDNEQIMLNAINYLGAK